MGSKDSIRCCIQPAVLQIIIVLSLCIISVLGGIAPDKSNAKDGFEDRPKRQEGNLFYTSVCEGRTMDLRCPPGQLIVVEWANFGRTDTETCVGYGPIDDTDCRSEGVSFDIVSQMCNNKASCSIRVSSTLFGDPCIGTYKYLEVQFECVVAPTTTAPPPTTTIKPPTTTAQEVVVTTPSKGPTMVASSTFKTLTTRLKTAQPPLPVETTAQLIQITTEGARTTTKIVTESRAPSTTQMQMCDAVMERGISWPQTPAMMTSRQLCPEGTTGFAVWHCESTPGHPVPRWFPESGPDLSACISVWVQNITKLAGTDATTSEVTEAVLLSVESTEDLYGGDIIEITQILDNSVEKLEKEIEDLDQEVRVAKTKEVTMNYVSITSTMLDTSTINTWDDLTKTSQSDTASHLITSLEESAFLLADNLIIGTSVSSQDDNVVLSVEVQDVQTVDVPAVQFPRPGSMESQMWHGSDSIVIPAESVKDRSPNGPAKVVFLAYNNLEQLLGTAGTHRFQSKMSNEIAEVIVNSRILSASINDPLTSGGLLKPAKLTFEHKQTENVSDPTCAFWHFINGSRGQWSDKGCIMVATNKTHTTCECNHLTNFAIIMNVRGVEISLGHHFALSVITYVGFMISIVCLIMAFVTFSFFKNIQNDRNTIHKNLVFCLLIAEIVFLAGISQTAKQGVCTAIALMLHYFFLASFCWMCLEGIQLYVMLVEVFEAESSRRKFYYPFGYGVPLFIVGVSAAIDFHSYGTEEYCWLAVDNNFIWAFVAPVILVIMVNTVFLAMAIFIMCRHSTMQTNPKEKTVKEKITSWLRGALVLLCLLGVTWAFGLMYVSESSIVFAYIFTIANSFQGLFIFIFHCCMNDKVCKEYRRYIRNNDWIPDCIQHKYGGSYASNQAQSRSSSSNGKRAAKDDPKRMSATTGSTSYDRDRKFSSSSYRNSVEFQGVKFTSLVIKAENGLENKRLSDEGIGLEIDDLQSPGGPNSTCPKDTPPDVSITNTSSSTHSSSEVVAPPVVTPTQVKSGSTFEKQPLLKESPLRMHSLPDGYPDSIQAPDGYPDSIQAPDGYPDSIQAPDGYPDGLPDVKRDTPHTINIGNSMPDLVFASSPWKVRKLPPSPTTNSPPPPNNTNAALNQSLPNLPRSPIMQRKREPNMYRRLNTDALSSPWAPRTPKPEEAIAIDNGPVEMVGYRKLKLETMI